MKKKSVAKIIGMTLGMFLVLASLLFVYEIHSLKQICFFDYDLTSRDAAFRDFEKLGFKYDEDIDVFQKKNCCLVILMSIYLIRIVSTSTRIIFVSVLTIDTF